jgi:ankyrin repeat protein
MSKTKFIDYAEKNNVEGLRDLLIVDENINQFVYGRTALHSACVSNAKDAAKFLIDNGVNINLQDTLTGAVPLHYCAVYNYFEIANIILEHKGKLNIPDNHGNQPLWTAVFNVKGKDERLPLVELYLMHGANKNHKNNAGISPLDFASQVKYMPLLDLFNKY